ncbi:ABC transporter ATP-binding protein [Geomonas nitrogeniifigens]|uniref:ABC transporter ATP-binding protein n=1 Tax=Geomonas diazotrophica TaxID=2843197 RepID=A0ABX8JL49_9BACT|nr:ABC transporter ATP-binding protein [Geomonas nitrogeniifigens]QWV97826.1 ABC transporter ATP-binding protein [Geomonas nitrogeniifigens]QXE86966.1 ABC transporter ATP-binding protein [Geomonas nitrogeniifigens]
MSGSENAIELNGLTKSFPGVRAVDGLSFAVRRGEIFGLVGPDGAGKTTTMRMLAGVLAPDEGSATVAGFDLARDAERAKHHISYMPQRFGLYEELTVDENIRFYADLFGVPRREREERSAELLKAAGMAEFRSRLAGKLSGGMKQKLGLVCALIHTPEVMLLDEPTNGVDPVSRRDFWRILYTLLDQGVTILTTTAYLDEAERCHRVALLHEGRMLFCDTPANLKASLPGAVLSIVCADPRPVRDLLAGTEGISTVMIVGDGLHLVVRDPQRMIPELRSRIAAAGLSCDAIEQVAPSIEDLFVEAVQGDWGDNGHERDRGGER